MRALIIGAGAVGRYLAARLLLGGHEAVLLPRFGQAAAINAAGVTLRVGEQEWPVAVKAAEPSDAVLREPFELVIVAVKSFSTAGVIETLCEMPSARESTILTVQNGLGNEEALAAAFGQDRIAAGALTTAVEPDGPAGVIANGRGGLSFAPVGSSPHNWLLPALAASGLAVAAAGDWRALKWSKLCLNLLANGVCAALDWTPAQVYADKTAFSVERACLVETVAAMSALRIKPVALVGFPVPLLVASVRTLSAQLLKAVLSGRVVNARGDKLPSLLIDLRAGRSQTEVGDMNGAVAARAAAAGLHARANDAVARAVTAIASRQVDWDTFRGNPTALAAAAGLS